MIRETNLAEGAIFKKLIWFSLPMIAGNILQQIYNLVDTLVVGRFIGSDALAAVGASYALTTVFISIAIGGGAGASVLTAPTGEPVGFWWIGLHHVRTPFSGFGTRAAAQST